MTSPLVPDEAPTDGGSAMRPFVFSCDAHIAEPNDLFTSTMTGALADWAPNALVEDGVLVTRLGEQVLMKIQANFFDHKVGTDEDTGRKGARDVTLRLADMERDGVDGESLFPTLGLMTARIPDVDAAIVASHVYNNWVWERVAGLRNTLVPIAALPWVDVNAAVEEFERAMDIGFRAVMMPCVPIDESPQYNDPAWDRVFALAERNDVPLMFHTAVGKVAIRAMRGPGGALFNYSRQMNDAIEATAALVGGGVLDRNPGARIVFLECGAGWLLGLAERMDEVYEGHAPYVSPKLSRRPSDIVRDQVMCSFQNDPGFVYTLKGMPDRAFVYASDYPHSEGTFPYSRRVVDSFMACPDATDDQKRNILGLNAARLFKTSPELVADEKEAFLAAV
jgi:predicted TIM-barrel fold metal-dependent hydrolase